MRFTLLAVPPVLVACSTSPPTPSAQDSSVTSGGDGGPLPTYDASEFGRLDYYWYGTGVSEKYSVDHDCGISGQTFGGGTPGVRTGEGIVGASDCNGFAELAVSPETMAIMTGATRCDFTGTDDYANLSLKVGATEYQRMLSGCSETPPFAHMKSELRRLFGLYAKSLPTDAGTDATGD